ncbi:unnamed protein product [Miscanthus lutarioriparius]|uniref:Uncharacterized protein n=1 Tax=Miscanthus lutarioriparius TaxID=422564 RepID=A0A811PJ71_9POAL|nr:unnamed protein product [Miscanthus lutarioriparius]
MAPPRMSFSSDFALEPPPPPRPPGRADADFEFSPAGSRPMMDADQLFSKGRILPLREAAPRPPTTLRDELQLRTPDAVADRGRRGPARWKELLGLKNRAHAHKKGSARAAASAADTHVHVYSSQDLGEHGEAAEAGE